MRGTKCTGCGQGEDIVRDALPGDWSNKPAARPPGEAVAKMLDYMKQVVERGACALCGRLMPEADDRERRAPAAHA